MSAPFILINEYTLEPGKNDEFLEGFRSASRSRRRPHLDFQAVRIYGTPTPAVLEQMRALTGDRVTVKPLAVGFDRFLDR